MAFGLAAGCGDDPDHRPDGGTGGTGGAEPDPDCIEVWPGGEKQVWCRPDDWWGNWVCWHDPEGTCPPWANKRETRTMVCYEFEPTGGGRYYRMCHLPDQCLYEVLDRPDCCKGVELSPQQPVGWCPV